jgi:hypothetical protein
MSKITFVSTRLAFLPSDQFRLHLLASSKEHQSHKNVMYNAFMPEAWTTSTTTTDSVFQTARARKLQLLRKQLSRGSNVNWSQIEKKHVKWSLLAWYMWCVCMHWVCSTASSWIWNVLASSVQKKQSYVKGNRPTKKQTYLHTVAGQTMN